MAVKYFDKEKNRWVIFPGTVGAPGKDAYTIAQENGYTGTREEFIESLVEYPKIKEKVEELSECLSNIDESPKQGSDNLVTSGGVYNSLEDLKNEVNSNIDDLDKKFKAFEEGNDKELEDINEKLSQSEEKITNVENSLNDANESISSLEKGVQENKDKLSELDDNLSKTDTKVENLLQQITTTEGELSELKGSIKDLIVDNLEDGYSDKALSAKQGVELRKLIENIDSFKVVLVKESNLPEVGEPKTLYLIKSKDSFEMNSYEEYLYIEEEGWEMIGTLGNVDLAEYYDKNDIDGIIENLASKNDLTDFVKAEDTLEENEIIISNGDRSVASAGITINDIVTNDNLEEELETIRGSFTEALDGYVKTDDIPKQLPNPELLVINVHGTDTNETHTYDGSSQIELTLQSPLTTVDTPGKPGIYYNLDIDSLNVEELYVTSESRTAIIIVKSEVSVTFGSGYLTLVGMNDSHEGTVRCYCIEYVADGVALVNCAFYE